MLPLHLLEPDFGEPDAILAWAPFAGARPVAELRVGARTVRERWAAALDGVSVAILSRELDGFHELDEPPVRAPGPVAGPAVVARSDFAVALGRVAPPAGVRRLVHAGRTVAWLVAAGETWTAPHDDGEAIAVDGVPLHGAADLVTALERLLGPDCDRLAAAAGSIDGSAPLPAGCIVLGDPSRVVAQGAQIEPGVVFDVRKGAIVLEEGVEVRWGARLEGPLYAGPGTRLLGGPIAASSFGPRCTARGEISNAVFAGYCNKGHEGFVGHSVLGYWVNLGAGTTTSNLKNTYGEVRLEVDGARLPTGRQFLGTLFGDHAKTAIGTMMSTGTVVGAGANVFGGAPPKYVPPMAWGSHAGERLDEEGFVRIASRVLPRRDIDVTPERRASLAAVYRRVVGA